MSEQRLPKGAPVTVIEYAAPGANGFGEGPDDAQQIYETEEIGIATAGKQALPQVVLARENVAYLCIGKSRIVHEGFRNQADSIPGDGHCFARIVLAQDR